MLGRYRGRRIQSVVSHVLHFLTRIRPRPLECTFTISFRLGSEPVETKQKPLIIIEWPLRFGSHPGIACGYILGPRLPPPPMRLEVACQGLALTAIAYRIAWFAFAAHLHGATWCAGRTGGAAGCGSRWSGSSSPRFRTRIGVARCSMIGVHVERWCIAFAISVCGISYRWLYQLKGIAMVSRGDPKMLASAGIG